MVKVRRGSKTLFDSRLADSLFKRFKGIMLEKNFKPLLFNMPFEERHSFHSLFCPEFEVAFLDSHKKILEIKKIAKPQFFSCDTAFYYVLEMPVGFIKKYGLRVGQTLEW